jgi:hypothetical protein
MYNLGIGHVYTNLYIQYINKLFGLQEKEIIKNNKNILPELVKINENTNSIENYYNFGLNLVDYTKEYSTKKLKFNVLVRLNDSSLQEYFTNMQNRSSFDSLVDVTINPKELDYQWVDKLKIDEDIDYKNNINDNISNYKDSFFQLNDTFEELYNTDADHIRISEATTYSVDKKENYSENDEDDDILDDSLNFEILKNNLNNSEFDFELTSNFENSNSLNYLTLSNINIDDLQKTKKYQIPHFKNKKKYSKYLNYELSKNSNYLINNNSVISSYKNNLTNYSLEFNTLKKFSSNMVEKNNNIKILENKKNNKIKTINSENNVFNENLIKGILNQQMFDTVSNQYDYSKTIGKKIKNKKKYINHNSYNLNSIIFKNNNGLLRKIINSKNNNKNINLNDFTI